MPRSPASNPTDADPQPLFSPSWSACVYAEIRIHDHCKFSVNHRSRLPDAA